MEDLYGSKVRTPVSPRPMRYVMRWALVRDSVGILGVYLVGAVVFWWTRRQPWES